MLAIIFYRRKERTAKQVGQECLQPFYFLFARILFHFVVLNVYRMHAIFLPQKLTHFYGRSEKLEVIIVVKTDPRCCQF